MEKITLSYVGRFANDKNGTPFVSKQGKPYTKLSLKANEYGDSWISGFDGTQTKNWKVGDTVEVEITKKGDYINFSVPKVAPQGMGNDDIRLLKEMINATNTNVLRVLQILTEGKVQAPMHYPTAEEEGIDLENVF